MQTNTQTNKQTYNLDGLSTCYPPLVTEALSGDGLSMHYPPVWRWTQYALSPLSGDGLSMRYPSCMEIDSVCAIPPILLVPVTALKCAVSLRGCEIFFSEVWSIFHRLWHFQYFLLQIKILLQTT